MNRKQLNSFKDSLMQVLSEANGYNWREAAIKKNEEKRARQAESNALDMMVKQEMANLRNNQNNPETSDGNNQTQGFLGALRAARGAQNGGSSSGSSKPPAVDEYELRAAAIDRLSGNEDFVRRANAIGQTVGRYAGDGSAGRFGYRYTSQAEADTAAKASRDSLYDREGNARIVDTENKRYDSNTGKWTAPMVGKADQPIKTASQETTDALQSSGNDIAAARAMEAQNRGDSGSGRSVNSNGTIDDAGRYQELQRQNQENNEQRLRDAEEARKPEPVKPFNYVNPNSPEGRIRARAEAEEAGKDDPESEFFDREANQAKIDAAKKRDEEIRAQASASLPAAREAYNKAVNRLNQMYGQFGRPVPAGVERKYPPPSDPRNSEYISRPGR